MNTAKLNLENMHADSASSEETSGFADLLLGHIPIELVLNGPESVCESFDVAAPARPSASEAPAAEATTPTQGRHWRLARRQR